MKREKLRESFFEHKNEGNRGSTRLLDGLDLDTLEKLINEEMAESTPRKTFIDLVYARFTSTRARLVRDAEKQSIADNDINWRVK